MGFTKTKFAVEALYLGDDKPPWEGWKTIRTYPSKESRDQDLARLITPPKSDLWDYRIKGR